MRRYIQDLRRADEADAMLREKRLEGRGREKGWEELWMHEMVSRMAVSSFNIRVGRERIIEEGSRISRGLVGVVRRWAG